MSATIQAKIPDLRAELVDWRQRLEATTKSSTDGLQLTGLLREVQIAIEALTQPESYGVCQVCHDLIGQATMTADPLARTCFSCFTPDQLKELEQDLDRAWSIQGDSLPTGRTGARRVLRLGNSRIRRSLFSDRRCFRERGRSFAFDEPAARDLS